MQAISPQQKNEMLLSYSELQKRSLEYAIKQLKRDIELIQTQITSKEQQLQSVNARIQELRTHQ